ncbi:MAG TPA: hypothetical protein VH325_03640 [Bryobacteraceae bacterium]|jgi:outer membrane protein assembly factor BamA|nr:hypothetical protein [Bryobacteraceae bacterium]
MRRFILLLTVLTETSLGQSGSFPLESVTLRGTAFSNEIVEQVAGLRIGVAVAKTDLDSACKRLEESGLFASVEYQYAPGPKHGYALTLALADQPAHISAAIDIPGVAEDEVWSWLSSQYPNLSHSVPDVDAAQQFAALAIERHVGAQLDGQHVVGRLESDLKTGRSLVVFQPEVLPQITSLIFTGVREFRSDQLADMLRKSMEKDGFSPRRFGLYLEGVVRQAYEEHGMYRMAFGKVQAQKTGPTAVAVSTEISEGPKFTLGEVLLVGDNLPKNAMREAAHFQEGKLANWREIQQGIYALEKPLKRTGYLDAVAQPERNLRDDQRQLDLRISFVLGPMYHFGEVSFTGLSPVAEVSARKMWRMEAGAPYDFAYSSDFLHEFSKRVDLRDCKVSLQTSRRKDHVVDETLLFERK